MAETALTCSLDAIWAHSLRLTEPQAQAGEDVAPGGSHVMLGSFGGFDVFPALQEWGTQQISPSEQTTILRAADELRDVHRIEAHCAGAALSLVLHGPHKRHTPGASLTVYASRMDTYVGPRYESLTMHLLATEDLGKAALGMGGPGTKILELTDHMFTSRPDWLPPYEQRRIHAAACLLQNLTKMYA